MNVHEHFEHVGLAVQVFCIINRPECKQTCVTYDSNALLSKLRLLLFERYKASFKTKWHSFRLYESLTGSKVSG